MCAQREKEIMSGALIVLDPRPKADLNPQLLAQTLQLTFYEMTRQVARDSFMTLVEELLDTLPLVCRVAHYSNSQVGRPPSNPYLEPLPGSSTKGLVPHRIVGERYDLEVLKLFNKQRSEVRSMVRVETVDNVIKNQEVRRTIELSRCS